MTQTPNWLNSLKNKKVAIVVAHPDDEVLWAGGLLVWWQKHCNNPITVVLCSIPETEPERAIKFQFACRFLSAKFHIHPYTEVRGGHLINLDQIDLSPYDAIFTHNHVGEYDHIHHKDVHNYVMSSYEGPVFCFAYGLPLSNNIPMDKMKKLEAIMYYDHVSALMGIPKYEELLERWGDQFDLWSEGYVQYDLAGFQKSVKEALEDAKRN